MSWLINVVFLLAENNFSVRILRIPQRGSSNRFINSKEPIWRGSKPKIAWRVSLRTWRSFPTFSFPRDLYVLLFYPCTMWHGDITRYRSPFWLSDLSSGTPLPLLVHAAINKNLSKSEKMQRQLVLLNFKAPVLWRALESVFHRRQIS